MAFYESVFIVRPDLAPNQIDQLVEDFTQIIVAQKGQVVKRENWGLRNLSYRINKHKKGHYVMLGIEGAGGLVAELERNYRIHEDVIRHLTVATETMDQNPSAMLKRSERSGRDSDSNEGDA